MAEAGRRRWVFAAGALAAVVALAVIWLTLQQTGWELRPPPANHDPLASARASRAQLAQAATNVPVRAEQPDSVAQPGACGFEPTIASNSMIDGRFTVAAGLRGGRGLEPGAFVTVAEEAAAEGRLRDAEVALIVACRMAAEGASGPTVPLADIQSQLGQHYAAAAALTAAPAARVTLLTRAHELLAETQKAYVTVLGRNASKTRIAAQRLASLPPPNADTEEIIAGSQAMGASRALSTDEADAAREAAEAAAHVPAGCAGARTAAQRLVCADPELAQMESDIRRLRAQAGSVARDPQGFQQRAAQAQARRDAACADKACLLRWYAQRRSQLLEEF